MNMQNNRKKRLYALKQERQLASKSEKHPVDAANHSADTEKTEGDDINNFLKDIVQRKKERKKQLEIIHDFFENPAAYGVDTDLIPSSTTTEEIDERKNDLHHKIGLLRSVLKALEGEMKLLSTMKQQGKDDEVSEDENSSAHPDVNPGKSTVKKKP